MDVARLGLAVDSSQVEKGTVSLHQLTGAAGQASAAARNLAGASNMEAAGQKAATSATVAHTAALNAQHAVMRSSMRDRTMMIYQLNDVAVSLASGMNPAMVAMQQGSQILQGGLMPAIRTLVDLGKGLVVTFWPVAAVIGAVAAGVAGLTYEINKTADVQVGFFDVALAGWQLFAEGIASVVAPVFGAIGSWLQQGWEAAAPILKQVGNTIIATFVGAYDAVMATWQMLPQALGDLMYQAAQNSVNGVIYLVRNVQIAINTFLANIDKALVGAGGKALGLNVGIADYMSIDNPYAGAAGAAGGAASDAFGAAMGRDYMGEAFDALSERAQKLALARKEAEELGGAAKAANDNVKKIGEDGFKAAKSWAEQFGEAAKGAFNNLGTGIIDAFKKGGNIASNVLNMLMDRVGQLGETLLNNGLNSIFNTIIGGMFGGGAWGVAGGFSGFPGIFGIPGMAEGGTVGRAGLSWVGENGPELLRLPAGAQVIPNGPAMSAAANQNQPTAYNDNRVYNIDARGAQVGVADQIVAAIKSYDRQLPNRMQEIQMRQG